MGAYRVLFCSPRGLTGVYPRVIFSVVYMSVENENTNKHIAEYYKLKKKYDDDNNKNKRDIMNNANLSKREKKNKFAKLVPKCVLCKQPGGTIFSNKYEETLNARQLSARCGHTAEPCNLDIKINTGKYVLLPYLFKKTTANISDLKTNVIVDKNQLLFGYKTTEETLSAFDELKEQITQNMAELDTIVREYSNVTDNTEDNDKLKELTEKSFEQIKNIREYMVNSNEEDDPKFVYDAVEIYTKELTPTLSKIMELKYKNNNMVWFNPDTRMYHLIQEKNGINNLEMDLIMPEVISYNVTLTMRKKRVSKEKEEEEEQ
jgi:hypothetical protein